jgi:hypothetical protein
MKFKTAVAGLMTAAALATAGPAAAAEPTRCGGEWTQEQTCSFLYGGGSIGVGLSLGPDLTGLGVVRLEADLPVSARKVSKSTSRRSSRRSSSKQTVRRVLLSCETFGMYGVCTAGQSGSEDIVPRGTRLYCTVTGRVSAAGRYQCDSQLDVETGTSGQVNGPGGRL